MTDERFLRCVNLILGPSIEGGWSDHPADRGGPTMRGITERTFRAAIRLGIIPSDTKHRELTEDQARAILRALYWDPPQCDVFPPPLDLLLLDGYINHRPGPAVTLLQKALREVDIDGIVGPETIRVARRHPRLSLVVARYITEREDFFELIVRGDASQEPFINGWKNRLVVIHREAMRDLAA